MRRLPVLLLTVVAAVALTACGGRPKPSPTPSVLPSATAVPLPANHACYALSYQQAVAPATPSTPVPCGQAHTSQTYAVGRLSDLLDGHLLGVDSAQVQQQVSSVCPKQMAAFVGGTPDQLRLSMIKPVWFTPTVAESDQGADWYRCDVVVLAGASQLSTVTGTLQGALGKGDTWSMCGTAEPGTPGFSRVPCGQAHTWKALSLVPLPAGAYPGEAAVRSAGQATCKQAGQNVAKDALKYQWGYEWPTADQWAAGQTYGVCWAPDTTG